MKSTIIRIYLICLSTALFLFSCGSDPAIAQEQPKQAGRIYTTSFETIEEFDPFYIVPPGEYDSTHELSEDTVIDGSLAHKAWILRKRADTNDGTYLPHRAYPTIQLYKTPQGSFITPCLISLWVNLDMPLEDKPTGQIDDWFSFVTLTPDSSDAWKRTILVNIVHDGYLHLMHVPDQRQQDHIWQASRDNDDGSLAFQFAKWVKIDVFIDFSEQNGYAKVFQDGELVSHARVSGGEGRLAQAHFGLYASAAINEGIIYNDELIIREIADENAAMLYILGVP